MYNCFQPHTPPLYEMNAPSFKQRFIYMTGIKDEAASPAVMERMDVRLLSAKLTMPHFVVSGEDDRLSDVACTIDHLDNVPSPKTLMMFAGEEHGMGGSRLSQLGTRLFDSLRLARRPLCGQANRVHLQRRQHAGSYAQR